MEISMRKTNRTTVIVCSVLLALLLVGAVGLLVWQGASNGWVFDRSNLVKGGLVIIGLILSLVRMLSRAGGGSSLRGYESAYREHIGGAFAAPDRKKQKNALLRAIADYNQNKYSSAISRLEALYKECTSGEEKGVVQFFIALTYSDQDMTDEAIAAYERSVGIYPRHSTAWSNLGLLYRQKGDSEKSIECIETALDYDRENAFAWNNLAQAYLSAGKWDQVLAPALRALELKNNFYQAETALTVAYYVLDDQKNSKKYFDLAVLHGANADRLTSVLHGMSHGTVAFGDTNGVREEVVQAVGHLQRDTAIPMVEVRLPAPNDGNRSRIGGAPVDKEAPLDSEGNPMKLLAAIWCSEVHGVPDFPERGVLRFYIADNDLYGADFDAPAVQKDFRVLFDENEDAFDSSLREDPSVSSDFPIFGAFPVRLTPAMSAIRSSDYRYDDAVHAAVIKAGITDGKLEENELDFIYDQTAYAGHRIGGYPCFEQEDPRGYGKELRKYDTLLLQIVSHTVPDEKGKEKELIMFGDAGGCQFFIPHGKLVARDFSDVMYWWDCG